METLKSFYGRFFKEFRDGHKGQYIHLYVRDFIKEFYWQHRYAVRRMWVGYDDVDIFNFNSNLKERLLVLLKVFKKHNICLFVDNDKILTEKETDDILDKMIDLLELSVRDEFESTNTTEEIIKNYKESLDAFNSFLDLFKVYGEQINY